MPKNNNRTACAALGIHAEIYAAASENLAVALRAMNRCVAAAAKRGFTKRELIEAGRKKKEAAA